MSTASDVATVYQCTTIAQCEALKSGANQTVLDAITLQESIIQAKIDARTRQDGLATALVGIAALGTGTSTATQGEVDAAILSAAKEITQDPARYRAAKSEVISK